jgi:hypothetical protein
LYDPDLWTDEFAFLSRPGEGDIQMDLCYDHLTNVASYPAWQEWLRRHQSRLPYCGAALTGRSWSMKPKHTGGTCPAPKSTFSMWAISLSTNSRTRSLTTDLKVPFIR